MPSSYIKGYSDKKASEFIKNNYDQFSLRVPKGDREKYKKLADSQGKSLNQLIIELLDTEHQRINKEQQAERVWEYAKRLNDNVATLSVVDNNYSLFSFGDINMKFKTSPHLIEYCQIIRWDKSGYIDCTCKVSTSKEIIEDTIDIAFIAKRLHVPLKAFNDIEEVLIV